VGSSLICADRARLYRRQSHDLYAVVASGTGSLA
jgi:hypothetical protein